MKISFINLKGRYIMKKILAALLVALMVVSLAGCAGGAQVQIKELTEYATPDEIKPAKYKDTLEGLCNYMAALGYAYDVPASYDEAAIAKDNNPKVMAAKEIGADAGYKFRFKLGEAVYALEFYSFSDFEGEIYKSAKADGKFVMGSGDGETEINNVYISDSGKYMLIYHSDKDAPETKDKIVKAFKGFYA